MRTFDTLGKKKVVIGMLHLGVMPGTPFYEEGSYEETFERALEDARALYKGGADGCLVQTVDRVYSAHDEADYARVVGVANIVRAIAQETEPSFQIGVQLMINALKPSLAIAKVCGGSFLRCYAYVGATLSPSGMVEAIQTIFYNIASSYRHKTSSWWRRSTVCTFTGLAASRQSRWPGQLVTMALMRSRSPIGTKKLCCE